jgi:hypothetical protein
MAQLIRSAKSGSDWSSHELRAYNIVVENQDAATFFGMENLPLPSVDPALLTATDPEDSPNDDVYEFLRLMDLAMNLNPGEESAVDDFAAKLLRTLHYSPMGKVIRARKDIPLVICGENRHAKTDVCILDKNEIILLVQEDKRHMEWKDPEPQLVAEAIAAFAENNRIRKRLDRPRLYSKVIPGITMTGTAPTFYKIEVTVALEDCVVSGIYPPARTTVYVHYPKVPRREKFTAEGMKPLDNRRIILSCYEAFKQFVV